jgi:crotonobetainyl-CoA:carnitine CoA-transferase CaiB-like acyl-CoA transferase
MTTDDGGVTEVVLLPLLMGGRRPGVRSPLPRAGEHNDEILSQLASRQAA